jgi:hypothetical protein
MMFVGIRDPHGAMGSAADHFEDPLSGGIATFIIRDSNVQAIFINLAAFAVIMLIFFTILQIIREHYKDKHGGNPYVLVFRMIKALVLFMFVTAACIVGLMLSNYVLQALHSATGGGRRPIAGTIFVAMASAANRVNQGIYDRDMIDDDNKFMALIAHDHARGWVWLEDARTIPIFYGGNPDNPITIENHRWYCTGCDGGNHTPSFWDTQPCDFGLSENSVRGEFLPSPVHLTLPENRGGSHNPDGSERLFHIIRFDVSQLDDVMDLHGRNSWHTHREIGLANLPIYVQNSSSGKTNRAARYWANKNTTNEHKGFRRLTNHENLNRDIGLRVNSFNGPGSNYTDHGNVMFTAGEIDEARWEDADCSNWCSSMNCLTSHGDGRSAYHYYAITVNVAGRPINSQIRSYGALSGSFYYVGERQGAWDPELTLFGYWKRHHGGLSADITWNCADMTKERKADYANWIDDTMSNPDLFNHPIRFYNDRQWFGNPDRRLGEMRYDNIWVVNQLYDIMSFNWIIGFGGLFIALGVYNSFAFGMIQRVAELGILYIFSPVTLAFFPFDDGAQFNNAFVKPFYKKAIASYAPVLSLNLFFTIMPAFNNIIWFENRFFNGIMTCIVSVALLSMLPKVRTTIQTMLGADPMEEKKMFGKGGLMENAYNKTKDVLGSPKKGMENLQRLRTAAALSAGRRQDAKNKRQAKRDAAASKLEQREGESDEAYQKRVNKASGRAPWRAAQRAAIRAGAMHKDLKDQAQKATEGTDKKRSALNQGLRNKFGRKGKSNAAVDKALADAKEGKFDKFNSNKHMNKLGWEKMADAMGLEGEARRKFLEKNEGKKIGGDAWNKAMKHAEARGNNPLQTRLEALTKKRRDEDRAKLADDPLMKDFGMVGSPAEIKKMMDLRKKMDEKKKNEERLKKKLEKEGVEDVNKDPRMQKAMDEYGKAAGDFEREKKKLGDKKDEKREELNKKLAAAKTVAEREKILLDEGFSKEEAKTLSMKKGKKEPISLDDYKKIFASEQDKNGKNEADRIKDAIRKAGTNRKKEFNILNDPNAKDDKKIDILRSVYGDKAESLIDKNGKVDPKALAGFIDKAEKADEKTIRAKEEADAKEKFKAFNAMDMKDQRSELMKGRGALGMATNDGGVGVDALFSGVAQTISRSDYNTASDRNWNDEKKRKKVLDAFEAADTNNDFFRTTNQEDLKAATRSEKQTKLAARRFAQMQESGAFDSLVRTGQLNPQNEKYADFFSFDAKGNATLKTGKDLEQAYNNALTHKDWGDDAKQTFQVPKVHEAMLKNFGAGAWRGIKKGAGLALPWNMVDATQGAIKKMREHPSMFGTVMDGFFDPDNGIMAQSGFAKMMDGFSFHKTFKNLDNWENAKSEREKTAGYATARTYRFTGAFSENHAELIEIEQKERDREKLLGSSKEEAESRLKVLSKSKDSAVKNTADIVITGGGEQLFNSGITYAMRDYANAGAEGREMRMKEINTVLNTGSKKEFETMFGSQGVTMYNAREEKVFNNTETMQRVETERKVIQEYERANGMARKADGTYMSQEDFVNSTAKRKGQLEEYQAMGMRILGISEKDREDLKRIKSELMDENGMYISVKRAYERGMKEASFEGKTFDISSPAAFKEFQRDQMAIYERAVNTKTDKYGIAFRDYGEKTGDRMDGIMGAMMAEEQVKLAQDVIWKTDKETHQVFRDKAFTEMVAKSDWQNLSDQFMRASRGEEHAFDKGIIGQVVNKDQLAQIGSMFRNMLGDADGEMRGSGFAVANNICARTFRMAFVDQITESLKVTGQMLDNKQVQHMKDRDDGMAELGAIMKNGLAWQKEALKGVNVSGLDKLGFDQMNQIGEMQKRAIDQLEKSIKQNSVDNVAAQRMRDQVNNTFLATLNNLQMRQETNEMNWRIRELTELDFIARNMVDRKDNRMQ